MAREKKDKNRTSNKKASEHTSPEVQKLKKSIQTLRAKNAELTETLRVIQSGEVDALVVSGPLGERIFTLQTAEQPYRELVEAMNEGAVTVSPDGIILYCNAKFETMTNISPALLVGSDFRAHIRPESRQSLERLLERSRHKPTSAEILLHVEGKRPLPVQLSVSKIELVGAEGFCVIATDLSAQKESAMVFEEQEWLGTLLNLLPVPLVLLEPNLRDFTFINVMADEMLNGLPGLDDEDPLIEMQFEDEDGHVVGIVDLLFKFDRNTMEGFETVLVTKQRKIPVLFFSEILPAMHGREPARLVMFQDISALKQAQHGLKSALRGRDQFMAALSHELRTPLNVILGWVQLLRANPTDTGMVKQALDTLERNADLQRDLIEDLLDMSRIITGNLVLDRKPLDLKASVRDCLTSLTPRAEEKGITLQVDVVDEPAVVSADDKRIQQLISNLVGNSIKFTPSGGKIIVAVRSDLKTGMATIEVQDNGRGIDSSFLPHVFDQFKQENMSNNRTYGGLGLGLAICKTIVEQHHGKMTAHSEGRGKGSLFSVRFPLAIMSQKVESSVVSSVEKEVDLKDLRILVVDDSTDNLALFSIWLKRSGASIKTLDSASGVVDALITFNPHVLLSDISMPGEDGYALISKVRALPPDQGGDIPAGALTANARVEDREMTRAAGYQLHISKPVTSQGLVQAVKTLAEMRRSL